MSKIKLALYAALTALVVGVINWVINPHFITGFISGWKISSWFH